MPRFWTNCPTCNKACRVDELHEYTPFDVVKDIAEGEAVPDVVRAGCVKCAANEGWILPSGTSVAPVVDDLVAHMTKVTGVPESLLLGTRSGRTSAAAPNPQSLPRESPPARAQPTKERTKNVRK